MKAKSTRHDTLLLVPKWRIKMLFQKGRFYLLLLMIPLLTSGAFAQTVTGKVADEKGESLPGVNVILKGTVIGETTDAQGNYSINISDNDKILVFSYVGFLTQEIPVGNETVLNVTLVQDAKLLSEIVVVGYGTQEKVNLTGSVSSVSSSTLLQRPAVNAANLLQGRATGLQVIQPTGSPGRDDPRLQIRGLGSFGASSNPLILVDGILGSINNLNPSDIESVSVLKDAASAAIYGSRAANGVILVTTKQGKKGESVLEYRVDVGVHTATRLPDFIYDSYEYMTMFNAAKARANLPPLYTQATIDLYKNPTDKAQYPSFNWLDYYFNPATVINHNLRFSGGNDKTTYSLSMGYLDQDGVLSRPMGVPSFNYKRYSAILNLNTQVNKILRVGTIINMVNKKIVEPASVNSDVVLLVYQGAPNFTPFLPDGSGRVTSSAYPNEGHNRPPEADLDPGSSQNSNTYALNSQVYIDVTPFKGLVWQVKGGLNYTNDTYKSHIVSVPQYYFIKPAGAADYAYANDRSIVTGLIDRYTISLLPSLYSTLTYDTRIGTDHTIKVLAGYEQQSFKTQFLQGGRIQFPSKILNQINAGSPVGQSLSGTATEWAIRSYFGRMNYDYKSKYLLEANVRYDGSSRIAEDNRWGVFPGISAGWRLSEENFIQNKFGWIDNMKLRASLGTLGNQEIGLYPYQDILSITEYPYGSQLQPGVFLTRLTDKNIKWESTRVIDVGLDLDISKRLFGMSFDWFKKNTFDILTGQPVPGSLGVSGPVTNDGKLQNTGWETELKHANQIGAVSYDAYFLISAFENKLLKIRTPTKGVNEEGLPYGSYYMYEWIGIFQSQEDINSSPTQPFFPAKPGDLKIKDQNGDGVVNADDRKTIDGKYPDFIYSFGLNVSWKGFGLSAFFQGTQGNKMPLNGWGIDPFIQGTPPTTKFRNAWSPTNPSNTVPAVYDSWSYGGVAAYPSTYYLQDASYLRLKNVNLSYTLPKRITDKISSKGLTVYVSGDNLLTFTKFEGADPETLSATGSTIGGWGRYAQFPQVRIINFGLDVKF
ncbi:MAG: TonB-dependent receptor [Cyclobacteriaceae bacterium]